MIFQPDGSLSTFSTNATWLLPPPQKQTPAPGLGSSERVHPFAPAAQSDSCPPFIVCGLMTSPSCTSQERASQYQ